MKSVATLNWSGGFQPATCSLTLSLIAGIMRLAFAFFAANSFCFGDDTEIGVWARQTARVTDGGNQQTLFLDDQPALAIARPLFLLQIEANQKRDTYMCLIEKVLPGGYDYDHLVLLTRGKDGVSWIKRKLLSANTMRLPDGRIRYVSKIGMLSSREISLHIGETSARAAPYKVSYKSGVFDIATTALILGDNE